METYKYATIRQLEKIFFKDVQYSYNVCRRRLGAIADLDYIKVMHDKFLHKNIYMWNDKKVNAPSYHRIILLDLLAEIQYSGYKLEKFDVEKEWGNGDIRSDAFVQFAAINLAKPDSGKRIYLFVEVQTSNNKLNLDKYDKLFETGEVQSYIGKSHYPRVLLISDRQYSNVKLKHTEVLQISRHAISPV
jgi:hypothetical protein